MRAKGLKLRLMGAPTIYWHGQPRLLSRHKAMALLAFLALEPGYHQREWLAEWLWPGSIRGRQALRTTFYHLNRRLSPDLFVRSKDVIGLNLAVPLVTDISEFTAAVRGGARSLRIAVGLYRGDFMAGFHVGSDPFERWRRQWQTRLRESVLAAFAQLTYAAINGRDFVDGLTLARRWLAFDPMSETAHRELIKIYGALGRHQDAMRQFKRCQSLLWAEFGLAPGHATVEAARAATRRSSSDSAAGMLFDIT